MKWQTYQFSNPHHIVIGALQEAGFEARYHLKECFKNAMLPPFPKNEKA
jgi:hypothetical protein